MEKYRTVSKVGLVTSLLLALILVFPSVVSAYDITTGGTTGTDNYGDFGNSGNQQMAQRITTSGAGTVSQVVAHPRTAGTPGDNFVIEIQPDSSGSPSGTPITNGTSNNSSPNSASCNNTAVTVTWATPPSLSASTDYWLVFKRTGSLNDSNFYYTCGGTTYTDPMKSYNGSAWSAYFANTVSAYTITTITAAAAAVQAEQEIISF